MSNNLIRFQLRTSEDFDAVRIGLGRFMHSLETSNTQYDFGEIELVLAEVLNNIAEHGGKESINHPISLKWHTSDGLCINVIDAGQCIPTETITNAQMPDLDTEIDDLPEGGLGWALVDILCSKVRSKRRGAFNILRLYFSKNNTAPKNPYFALKFVASLREYYPYKPHNWLFSVSDFRPHVSGIESNCGCQYRFAYYSYSNRRLNMRDFYSKGRSTVFAENGMCATSHPIAAQAAVDVLKDDGNAMDAAIAGAVLLGICEPQMTGIGGDCFVLFSPAGRDDVLAMNGSGRAPANLTADKLREAGHDKVPLRDPSAVTIPTAIDAFCTLSEDWGKLGLDRILQPAIQYARNGVAVAPRVGYDWSNLLDTFHETAIPFFTNNGSAPATGTRFSYPGQAEIIEKIASQGRDGFYSGDVCADMVETLRSLGGHHTEDDFANARAEYTNPISGSYGKYELIEHPPNGQGATAILMANMLKNFDIASLDPFGVERAHIEAEISKLAYDARNRLIADPTVTDGTERMLSIELANELSVLISKTKVNKRVSEITEVVHKDTVYISVVDRDRMSVSLIYSIFHGFGSGIASRKYGVLFQNRGAGFNLIKGHPNELTPGKRPMHTIIPGMLREGSGNAMPLGVMGGQYQPCGHIRVLSNLIDYGMDIQAALDGPRSFAEGNILNVEPSYDPAVVQGLSDLGHDVNQTMPPIGGAQAILENSDGFLVGGSDPRKDGCAIGY